MYIAVTKFNMYMYYMTIFKIYYFAECSGVIVQIFYSFFFLNIHTKKTKPKYWIYNAKINVLKIVYMYHFVNLYITDVSADVGYQSTFWFYRDA